MKTGGSTTKPRKSGRNTAVTPEWIPTVKEHFDNNPHESIRRASFFGWKKTSIVRALESLNFHLYKIEIVQKLKDSYKKCLKSSLLMTSKLFFLWGYVISKVKGICKYSKEYANIYICTKYINISNLKTKIEEVFINDWAKVQWSSAK